MRIGTGFAVEIERFFPREGVILYPAVIKHAENECPDADLPRTESLEQTIARILPYWHCVVFPSLMRYDSLLVVAHGNSLRGVIKHLKGIPDDRIAALNLPTAVPYVFEFDDALRLVRDYYLGDPEEIRRRAEAVARQGSAR